MDNLNQTLLPCIEDNVSLLDESVSEFLFKTFYDMSETDLLEYQRSAMETMATFLTAAFHDTQEIIDVCVLDEKLCKWEGLNYFNELCAKYSKKIVPDPIWLYHKYGNNGDVSNIDFTFYTKQDKAMLINTSTTFAELGPNQKKMYVPVMQLPTYSNNNKIFFGCELKHYASGSVRAINECTVEANRRGAFFTPVEEIMNAKLKNGNSCLKFDKVPTLIPKEIVEKYGFDIRPITLD